MTFFAVIAAVEAVLVEPDHNPMKLDHGTPSVSGLALGFGVGFEFEFEFGLGLAMLSSLAASREA
jgi:hypothetical protein